MDLELTLEVKKKYILHWNYRGFIELPEELKEQGGRVQEMYLKWNKLSCLPVWLGALQSLTNLYLQHNQLSVLPDEIGHLPSLSVIDVTHNRVETVTPLICHLQNLTTFLAADNLLKNLPNEFRMLQSLETLDLSENAFSFLPSCVCECRGLKELLLDNNSLSCLPANIVYLPNLAALSVCGNKLLYLPMLPFISSPCLRFNNNPHLNYISYPLGCQVTSKSDMVICGSIWDLNSYGCFLGGHIPEAVNSITLVVVPDGALDRETHLVMPNALKYICPSTCNSPEVPSLYELAMRVCYCFGFHQTLAVDILRSKAAMKRTVLNTNMFKMLPSRVRNDLVKGPTALCFLPYCQQPIFTYVILWVIPKWSVAERRYDVIPVSSTIMFCSAICSRRYLQWEDSNALQGHVLTDRQLRWTLVQSKLK